MICYKCGKPLPDESEFCPYCMEKFSKAYITTKPIKKKKTKGILIAVIAVLAAAAVSLGGITVVKSIKRKTPVQEPKASAQTIETSAEKPTQTTTEETETTTTTTTKKTTTTTATQPRPSSREIADEYMHVLASAGGSLYAEYYLYDMNGDGIPELITKEGDSELDANYNFYTIYKGKFQYSGSALGAHSALYAPKSGNGVIVLSGHMGGYDVTRYTIDGAQFSREDVESGSGIGESITFDDIAAKHCAEQLDARALDDYDYILSTLN